MISNMISRWPIWSLNSRDEANVYTLAGHFLPDAPSVSYTQNDDDNKMVNKLLEWLGKGEN